MADLLNSDERLALKTALAVAVRLTGCKQAEVCEHLSADQPWLSRAMDKNNPANAGHMIRLDDAIALDRQAGAPVLIARAARMLGHMLVPLPEICGRAPLSHETAVAVKELGEALTAIGAALADDGAFTDEGEIDVAITELEDGQAASARLIEGLRRLRRDMTGPLPKEER